jgi:hypothetical protein
MTGPAQCARPTWRRVTRLIGSPQSATGVLSFYWLHQWCLRRPVARPASAARAPRLERRPWRLRMACPTRESKKHRRPEVGCRGPSAGRSPVLLSIRRLSSTKPELRAEDSGRATGHAHRTLGLSAISLTLRDLGQTATIFLLCAASNYAGRLSPLRRPSRKLENYGSK